MRRPLFLLLAAVSLVSVLLGACSGDDDDPSAPTTTTSPLGPRFCDAYLEYLGDSTPARLDVVDSAADDERISQYASIIADPSTPVDGILAASGDLDNEARRRCQSEWTAGAQGAGNTGAAAQALFDALVAGDRVGAANIASANALAVFEPWAPLADDASAEKNSIVEIGEEIFTLALGERLVVCQAETGVVIACQVS